MQAETVLCGVHSRETERQFLARRRSVNLHGSGGTGALEQHHIKDMDEDTVLTVVINGKNSLLAGFAEHNARQPNYRHTVAQVRGRKNPVV